MGDEEGEKRINSLASKVSHVRGYFFLYKGEDERGENNKDREEGGGREWVGGEGDNNHNFDGCLWHYPLQR